MDAARTYHPLSIGLHWAMVVMIVALVACGFVMDELPKGDLKFAAFNTHRLFAVIVLALVAVRLAWRAGHPPPSSDDMPAWQQAAAATARCCGCCRRAPGAAKRQVRCDEGLAAVGA